MWGSKKIITDSALVEAGILERGVDEVIDKENLKKRLLSGDRLRIKLGIDPTSANLHLGRSIPLLKLRDFQELGHQIILLIGDATGVVGDTSDKDSERPMLTRKDVNLNKKTYLEQVGKLLSVKDINVRHNSEWLDKLKFDEIGEQANQFSVSDFIARDNIKRRLDSGSRVSLREMIYPLMQGYDSVAIEANVEIGGTDQRFNLLAGRTLQKHYKQEPQDVVIGPLIEGTDGRKMSSSFGNTINFNDDPNDMYGKVMSINDDLVSKYFDLCTRVSMDVVNDSKSASGEDMKKHKMHLAREIVSMYYNESVAVDAESNFSQTFSDGETPNELKELSQEGTVRDTLVSNNIIKSNTEWTRLIDAGAVKNMESGETISDRDIVFKENTPLKVGKKIFVRINVN